MSAYNLKDVGPQVADKLSSNHWTRVRRSFGVSDNLLINVRKRIRTSSKRYLNVNLDNSLATTYLPCIINAERSLDVSMKSVDIDGVCVTYSRELGLGIFICRFLQIQKNYLRITVFLRKNLSK